MRTMFSSGTFLEEQGWIGSNPDFIREVGIIHRWKDTFDGRDRSHPSDTTSPVKLYQRPIHCQETVPRASPPPQPVDHRPSGEMHGMKCCTTRGAAKKIRFHQIFNT